MAAADQFHAADQVRGGFELEGLCQVKDAVDGLLDVVAQGLWQFEGRAEDAGAPGQDGAAKTGPLLRGEGLKAVEERADDLRLERGVGQFGQSLLCESEDFLLRLAREVLPDRALFLAEGFLPLRAEGIGLLAGGLDELVAAFGGVLGGLFEERLPLALQSGGLFLERLTLCFGLGFPGGCFAEA